LSRLNASSARVIKKVALLEQSGIFDAQTIAGLHPVRTNGLKQASLTPNRPPETAGFEFSGG